MKVAIIGAGISGLSCALELKRNGIIPVIFERKSCIGKSMNLLIAVQYQFIRTYRDPLKYLRKQYGLGLTPLHLIKEITLIGPSKSFTVKGNLGYVFKKGEEDYSIENQIASFSGLPIMFDTEINILDIKDEFDAIVVATGASAQSKDLGVWTTTFNCYTRVATVLGDFRPGSVTVWVNTKFAKNSFCFFIANNEKQGYIALTIDNITHQEIDKYWKQFLSIEDINYQITEIVDHEENLGFTHSPRVGNVYFVGNSVGAIDNFMGFGSISSIESGFMAARAIADKGDYNELVQPVIKNKKVLHYYRDAINTFNNDDYDKLITLLGLPGIKHLLYSSRLFKARQGTKLAKLYSGFKYR